MVQLRLALKHFTMLLVFVSFKLDWCLVGVCEGMFQIHFPYDLMNAVPKCVGPETCLKYLLGSFHQAGGRTKQ